MNDCSICIASATPIISNIMGTILLTIVIFCPIICMIAKVIGEPIVTPASATQTLDNLPKKRNKAIPRPILVRSVLRMRLLKTISA